MVVQEVVSMVGLKEVAALVVVQAVAEPGIETSRGELTRFKFFETQKQVY